MAPASWLEREGEREVHEARKPYEAISLADSDTQRERGSKSPSTKIGTNKTKLGWSKCGFVIQFSRIALLNSDVKILRLRMTKSVILVIFSVHCGEKIWIIVNFY